RSARRTMASMGAPGHQQERRARHVAEYADVQPPPNRYAKQARQREHEELLSSAKEGPKPHVREHRSRVLRIRRDALERRWIFGSERQDRRDDELFEPEPLLFAQVLELAAHDRQVGHRETGAPFAEPIVAID